MAGSCYSITHHILNSHTPLSYLGYAKYFSLDSANYLDVTRSRICSKCCYRRMFHLKYLKSTGQATLSSKPSPKVKSWIPLNLDCTAKRWWHVDYAPYAFHIPTPWRVYISLSSKELNFDQTGFHHYLAK